MGDAAEDLGAYPTRGESAARALSNEATIWGSDEVQARLGGEFQYSNLIPPSFA